MRMLNGSRLILFYNNFFGRPWNLEALQHNFGFTFSDNVNHFSKSDIVIFHMPGLTVSDDIFKIKKKKSQVWVFVNFESESNYEWQYGEKIISMFDITVTYKMNSTIPLPYTTLDLLDDIFKPAEKKGFFINSFISSDVNKSLRIDFLEELMQYLDVHAYGRIFQNRTVRKDLGFKTKIKIISNYKFTLALENSIDYDYVTEKFFDPLRAGSVPVYLGAPNIEDFAPGDQCFVNVDSFSTIKELSQYLIECDNDKSLYERHFYWKNHPLRSSFLDKIYIHKLDPFQRLFNELTKYF